MQRIHETIHTLRQKPQHVRENIAIGVAGGLTFIVSVIWLAVNVSGGTFALAPDTFEGAQTGSVHDAFNESKNGFSDLLGAAGSVFDASSSPAKIEVVDSMVHSTLDSTGPDPDATVIHF